MWYEGRQADLVVETDFGCIFYACRILKLREVLTCPRVDQVPIPSTPSFNCECERCGARVWVAYSSPIEPIRMCVTCSAAHDDRIQQAH